ncbi:MAG: 3-dehydroquinate synthase [Actinomycetes bacterium]
MTNTARIIDAPGTPGYKVIVGRGLLEELDTSLGDAVRKVLLVYPEGMQASAELIAETLIASGKQIWQLPVADGENAKTDKWLSVAWSSLGQAEFSRSDAVVSLGGGSTTDLAGFIAATWLRGIAVVHVPTTLLGMVDAAIGGKTGINTLEGKNLVGAFHEPKSVIVDLDTLESLPKLELISGFGEIVKYGFIADPVILDLIEEDVEDARNIHSDRFEELVTRSIAIKTSVVGQDFKESSLREILNYGHTLAHSIELVEHFKWRHGRAVSVGLCFAAELGRLTGRLSDDVADRHARILKSLDLPTSYPADRWESLYTGMQVDKKSRGGMLRFVVLDGLAKPGILEAPTKEMLFTAYQEIAE